MNLLGIEIAASLSMDNTKRVSKVKTSPKGGSKMIHMMDAMSLHRFMFPEETNCMIANYDVENELELVLAQKKMSWNWFQLATKHIEIFTCSF